jgi:peptide/nickel transport system permease protein
MADAVALTQTNGALAEASERKRKRSSFLARYAGQPGAIISLALLLLLVAMAIAPSLFAPHSPLRPDLMDAGTPPAFLHGGSLSFPLGKDQLGRDILSRLIYGARITVIIGLLGTAISYLIGVVLGLVAGYLGGWVDEVIMRFTDIQLAFPFLLLAIVIVAVLGPSLTNVIIVLALTRWTTYARLVRGQVLAAREEVYVESARAIGVPNAIILFRHIFPNIIAPTIVIASFDVGANVIVEASLSFLGLGVQPPQPSWGNMLADGRIYLPTAWWISTIPGIALSLTLILINIQGDRLRDLLDPTVRT